MENEHPLSQAEFDKIYSRVPRLTVEVIFRNYQNETFLTKRSIPPCEGEWHLPGGTVRFGEPLQQAVKRVAKRELGVEVVRSKNVGVIEYPSHYENGLDSPVGIVFEVGDFMGKLVVNEEASESGWFSVMPRPMHADQDVFLVNNGYLREL
jgi:ADP-ribose pyrophosphatase YjhB (NUDIX family)